MDLMPTFLDLAGASHPSKDGKPAMFHGREVVPMRGKSWRSWMEGKEGDVHEGKGGKEVMMGWELHGRAAYRKGDWKIVYIREYIPSSQVIKLIRRQPHPTV